MSEFEMRTVSRLPHRMHLVLCFKWGRVDDKRAHHLQKQERSLLPEMHRMQLRNNQSRQNEKPVQHQDQQPPFRLPKRQNIRHFRSPRTRLYKKEQGES